MRYLAGLIVLSERKNVSSINRSFVEYKNQASMNHENLKANLRTIGSRCRLAGTGVELPWQVRGKDGPQGHKRQEDSRTPDEAAQEVRILGLEQVAKVQINPHNQLTTLKYGCSRVATKNG